MMGWIRKKIEYRMYADAHRRMVENDKIPDPLKSLSRLRRMGCKPETIFDVGAYKGEFADMCLSVWPDSKIYSFEGLPDKIGQLRSRFAGTRGVEVVDALVGRECVDEIEFYADETASSVFYSDEVATKKKVVRQRMLSLDSFITDKGLKTPSLLKIDTQGYEFPIILGCEKHIRDVEILLVETNFLEVYHGSTNASEVIGHLYERGFVIYDVCELHRRPLDNALFQADFLFVKKDSFLRENKLWDMKKS